MVFPLQVVGTSVLSPNEGDVHTVGAGDHLGALCRSALVNKVFRHNG